MYIVHSSLSQFSPLYYEFCHNASQCSHQRSQPTPPRCAKCEYVECLLLLLLLRFVECWCMHMPHCTRRPAGGVDHTKKKVRGESLVENIAKKEPQSFSHCGSFDHHGLQSLNNYKILFFILRLQN